LDKNLPSGFKPTVEDFFNPFQGTFALFRRDGDVIYFVSVDISDACHARQLFEFFYGADTDNLLRACVKRT
jgi:hypothetical protein